MTALAAGSSGVQYLWFLSRGSGVLLLLLFSFVLVLGVAIRLGSAPRWLARFAVARLHRTLSLFAVLLLVLHVITAMLDPYVSIGWTRLDTALRVGVTGRWRSASAPWPLTSAVRYCSPA